MCSKKFPSYTTNIFLSNAPQKIRQCALNNLLPLRLTCDMHNYANSNVYKTQCIQNDTTKYNYVKHHVN